MALSVGKSGSEDAYKAGKEAVEDADGSDADIVYVFASTAYDLEDVLKGVKDAAGETPIVGCTSTVEIADDVSTESVAVGAFHGVKAGIGIGTGLDDHSYNAGQEAIKQAVENFGDELTPFTLEQGGEHDRSTIINVFADPLHGNGVHVLGAISDFTGYGFSSAGQFAGDDLSFENTYVFYNGEVHENAVVCAVIDTGMSVGGDKAHGFNTTPNRYEVNDSEGAYVRELDGDAPADVYANIFGEDNATDPGFLLMTPFGIDLGEEEHQLRAALDVDDQGCFVCGAEVPQTDVTLMRAEKPKLLDAAGKAAREAREDAGLEKDSVEGALVYSCAGRHAIYDDMDLTAEEVERMKSEFSDDAEVLGLFAFGQIATSNGRPAFHEETASIQVFGEK